MSDLHDPPRWLETGALSPEIRRDMIAYANVAPGSERRARMLSALEQQIEVAEPAASGGSAIAGPLKIIAAIAAVCGSLAILVGMFTAPEPVRTPAVELASTPATPAPIALAEPVAPALAPDEVSEPVAKSEAKVRATKPRRRRARAEQLAPTAPVAAQQLAATDRVPAVEENGGLSELVLLARARRALLAHPQRALEFVNEHARRFPQGTFEEEREVLAIESLLKLAQVQQAEKRARAFAKRFPQSAHRARLEELVSPD